MLKLVDKKSTYESGKIDSLYRIGDKLIELKNNQKNSYLFDKTIDYIVSELHAYNVVVDYSRVLEDLKILYNIDSSNEFVACEVRIKLSKQISR